AIENNLRMRVINHLHLIRYGGDWSEMVTLTLTMSVEGRGIVTQTKKGCRFTPAAPSISVNDEGNWPD
ncbi:MAG: hypothetical protein ABI412_07475, partial [Sphingomicrobium sp.]